MPCESPLPSSRVFKYQGTNRVKGSRRTGGKTIQENIGRNGGCGTIGPPSDRQEGLGHWAQRRAYCPEQPVVAMPYKDPLQSSKI